MPTPEGLGVKLFSILHSQLSQDTAKAGQCLVCGNASEGLMANWQGFEELPQSMDWTRRATNLAMASPSQQATLQLVFATAQFQAQFITIQPQNGLSALIAIDAAADNWKRLRRHAQQKHVRE